MGLFANARRSIVALASRLASRITGAVATANENRYQGPPVPLIHPGIRIRYRKIPAPLHANGGKRPRVKGKRDSSLHSRSNRRKAAK